ncbi:MAG: HD domain-containing phosphohydrolase, partial [Bacillota bacterium]|nr:HD domain-containing phosphohydrolase [Bacillota bacterium]
PAEEGAAEACLRLAESYLLHGDPYLKRHGRMTGGYARQVGEKLGLSPEQLEELEIAAAFADISMKEAAGGCLEKPGCLSFGEYRRVSRHPIFAAELCRSLSLSAGICETVLCHHEALDGSGYPEGRQGEEIPLSASILGACGAFSAMLLPRPYRPARKLYAARAALSRGAGQRWPAAVVRELISL